MNSVAVDPAKHRADLAQIFSVPPKPSVALSDPLSPDEPTDQVMATTERRLQRLAIVAADAGARFERERIPYDPMAWMLTPLAMFDGMRPLEACQDLSGLTRGVLLHGLSLGLDADPSELDDLLSDDEDDDDQFRDAEVLGDVLGARHAAHPVTLFSSVIDCPTAFGTKQLTVFSAMTAVSEDAVRRRLAVRFGERVASAAVIAEGVNESCAVGFTSHNVLARLLRVAADPTGEEGMNFEITVELRSAV